MDIKDNVLEHLKNSKTMQLATVSNNAPWICNVHFVHDSQGNIYWLSTEDRRHSQEISKNPQIAISIAVKTNLPVIGVQASGVAEKVGDLKTIQRVMVDYVKKHGTGKEFYERALRGISEHKMYKMTPEYYMLFDEVNFPKTPPQKWVV